MNKIDKHGFEPVSLLTVENGLLDVSIIPAMNQPDWIVPTALIMSVDEYYERIWTYLWQNQEVVIYPLVTRDVMPNKIVVLEGNTDVHRVGLQINGDLQHKQVRISDVKDTTLPEEYLSQIQVELDNNLEVQTDELASDEEPSTDDENTSIDENAIEQEQHEQNSEADSPVQHVYKNLLNPMAYMFQAVMIDGETYLVPDLDELSHRLVDLDS